MAYDTRVLFMEIQGQLELAPVSSLSDLARTLRLSRNTIEKAARTATGQSWAELQKQHLLRSCEQALRTGGGKSIKEIAFAVGFTSPRSFSRFVRRARGCSPSELRQRLAGKGPGLMFG
jgi:AraC family transcriptional regulator